MAGKLHQRAEVSAQVRFTAHQQHLRVGAELLDLPLPLWRGSKRKRPFSNPGHWETFAKVHLWLGIT